MKLILISGSGIGAGKSTLAKKLGRVFSLADEIRRQLSDQYPGVDFYDKSQEAKNKAVLGTPHTVRDLLKLEGQLRRDEDETHWVKSLCDYITTIDAPVSCVDDVRFINEVSYFRTHFQYGRKDDVTHIHIVSPQAIYEPEFENLALAEICDYKITRKQ